jgi:glycosyltransferase A (GT-A) superfamily protein (DUF2064 family)
VVVVLDALAAPEDQPLRAALGPEVADALREALSLRAVQRATEWAGGPVRRAARAQELPELLDGREGPVLLLAPDVPAAGAFHLDAALEDIEAGVQLSFAPGMDGRPFLIGLPRPDPALLALATGPFESLAATAQGAGGEIGMLRPERRLATIGDARALLADPLAPGELRALLPATVRTA